MPLFSVIIPTYNRLDLLQEAVYSVRAQRCQDFEILVVDDGSSDGTVEWLESQKSKMNVLAQANQGPGAARNRGIQKANGDYVTFLDSDDMWFPWTLESFADIIQKEGKPAWIMGSPQQFDSQDELTSASRQPLKYTVYPDYLASSRIDAWVPGCGVAIRRDALLEAGGFSSCWINAEDSDLWLRLGAVQKFVHVQAPCTLAYRRHANTAVSNRQKLWEGMRHLIEQERAGRYPGGFDRRQDRLRILTRHLRPGSVSLAHAGWTREAWIIYRDSYPWNARLRRWKYLIGFGLVLAFQSAARSKKSILVGADVRRL